MVILPNSKIPIKLEITDTKITAQKDKMNTASRDEVESTEKPMPRSSLRRLGFGENTKDVLFPRGT